MPRYVIQCNECNYEFDKVTRKHYSSEEIEEMVECPKCGSKNCRRIYKRVSGVVYKAGGFFNTDNKTNNNEEKDKKDD